MSQARVLRNSERILTAGLDAAAEEGWAGLAPTVVARRAGLSQRAVQTRFPHRPDVGAAVWRERTAPALHQALTAALDWTDRRLERRTVCMIAPENLASLKLAARVGYRPYATTTYKDHPVQLFERPRRAP